MLHHVRQGNGPALLLAHGIGMSHRAFESVVGPLSADREVFAVDLPGFGDSPALAGPTTMRALADACAELMAACGHARFHVAGNSLGGGVALHLALDGRALSACALSPVGFIAGWERAYVHASIAQTRLAGPLAIALTRGPGRVPAVRRALVRQFAERGDRLSVDTVVDTFQTVGAATGFYAAMRHALNWRAPAVPGELPCPVTVAWGEHDHLLLTGPQSARAKERLPRARHVPLPGCGHLPAWDDPELVVRVVRKASGG